MARRTMEISDKAQQVLASLVEDCPRSNARDDCSIITALSHHTPEKTEP